MTQLLKKESNTIGDWKVTLLDSNGDIVTTKTYKNTSEALVVDYALIDIGYRTDIDDYKVKRI